MTKKSMIILTTLLVSFFLVVLNTHAMVIKNAKTDKFPRTTLSSRLIEPDEVVTNDLSDFPKLKPKWSQFWGGDHIERESKIFVDKEQGYIYVSGNTKSFNGFVQPFLLKYDLNGKLKWYKIVYNKEAFVYGLYVKDGSIYLTGLVVKSKVDTDVFVAKYNAEGEKLWFDTWGGDYCDIGFDIIHHKNAVYVCGRTSSYGKGCSDVLLLKYKDNDNSCNLIWYKTWGCGEDDEAIAITSDGESLYLCGSTEYPSKGGSHDGMVLKFDLSTNKFSLVYSWDGNDYDEFMDLLFYKDHVFAVGWTQSLQHAYDIILIGYDLRSSKLDLSINWGVCQTNIAYGIDCYEDYIFIAGEVSESSGFHMERAAVILKISIEGDIEWGKIWGKKYFAGAEDIALSDGDFYVTGRAFPLFKRYTDIFIFRCDKDGGKSVGFTDFLENIILHLRNILFWPFKMGVFEESKIKVVPIIKITPSVGTI
ncbi:MAG TPA: hypothetical protein ENG38_01500 [Thermoplasmatales archaeon]|nr:hypothetical protein [Thermoplasmatales archaeon]HEX08468.1 hypothetical protein [Thermoplasmatales archaeon]